MRVRRHTRRLLPSLRGAAARQARPLLLGLPCDALWLSWTCHERRPRSFPLMACVMADA